jgi:uncharacterized membrane protein
MYGVVDVVTELTINAPAGLVAAFAADPSNVPRWYQNISSVEWLSPKPVQVGSRIAFVARFLGRTLCYTYEIVEFVAGERLVMRTAVGPFPMETTYTWTALGDDQTRMTLRNRGEPAGFSKMMAPFMTPAMRRANRKDLAKLASIVETT